MDIALPFFPYPHVYKGVRHDGLLRAWPSRCLTCDRQCERSRERKLQLCSYGVNFYPVDDELLIAGVVVRDFPTITPARQKILSQAGRTVISRTSVEAAVAEAIATREQIKAVVDGQIAAIVKEYRASEAYKRDVVDLLRPDLREAFAQVHDYRQFVRRIVQNIDVILEERFPGLPIDEKLEKASHEEVAIYWAARLMDEKLDAALYVLYPDRIFQERRPLRFHGAVTKYLKIYKSHLLEKGLHLEFEGESWSEVEGNPRALTIIPHALIDNAIKYAPRGSTIIARFREEDDRIVFSVESLGPRIAPEERERIFEPFFRGVAAQASDPEGMGFGLAAAQHIAKGVGTAITLIQESQPEKDSHYRTTFMLPLQIHRQATGTPGQRSRGSSSEASRRSRRRR